MVGIIGGTGTYDVNSFGASEVVTVTTEYGDVELWKGDYAKEVVYFLPRHGANHERLAYQVQHHANIAAFVKLGVQRIYATVAAGGINPLYEVGDLVLLDQFISFHTTMYTYGKYSVDMTEPYCSQQRSLLLEGAKSLGYRLHERGNYLSFDGPRYETAGEIRAFAMLGADLVGMTNGPEASLAREMGLCYATIALVTNRAAGLSSQGPDLRQHSRVGKENSHKVLDLFKYAIAHQSAEYTCNCKHYLEKALQARSKH